MPRSFDPDLDAFSSDRVLHDGRPVLLVFHEPGGEWQFLSSEEESGTECVYVHVSHLVDEDPSINEISDLPRGWKAWRWAIGETWSREPIPSDQRSLPE